MAKNPRLRISERLYEDASGVVYRAKDAAGHKVHLRKPRAQEDMPTTEQVAHQVAIERLQGMRHPSLLTVVWGGSDPEDSQAFVAIKPVEGTHLAQQLKAGPLSIESATLLLSQALEVSELLSHLLADDGVWIETTPRSILLTEKSKETRFLFWPAPVKAMHQEARKQSFLGLIELAEEALNWSGRDIDEREGGHLQLWLKWLKDAGGDVPVREAREMLAAAAGVEPPEPIEQLVGELNRKRSLMEGLPDWSHLLKSPKPSMPLFALLSFMLVIQAIIGWIIVRSINDNIDRELQQLNATYTSTPYTADRDPSRKAEPGSQPLNFD